MEKSANRSSKNVILQFLPKVVAFHQSLPFSPGGDKRSTAPDHRGFSGPIISIVPAEARRKPRNGSVDAAPEPTSPKVSCMGQVKKCKNNDSKIQRPRSKKREQDPVEFETKKKQVSAIRRMFNASRTVTSDGRSAAVDDAAVLERPRPSPSLRRFASGRDALASFDWMAQVTPVDSDHRNSDSDGGGGAEKRE